MPSAPHLDFAGEIRAPTNFPTFHAARIQDVATARHAIASGKLDMVGMTRAHLTDPHIVRKIIEKREDDITTLRRRELLSRPHLSGRRRLLHPQRRDRPRDHHAARTSPRPAGGRRSSSSAPAPAAWRPRASRPSAGMTSSCSRRPNEPGGQVRLTAQKPATQGDDRHHRLADGAMRGRGTSNFTSTHGRRRRSLSRNRLTSSSSRPAACRIRKF